MRKFYIGTTETQIEMSYTLVETLDETLDNMTVSLPLTRNDTPYKPLTRFYVKEEWFNYEFSGDLTNIMNEPEIGDKVVLTSDSGDVMEGVITAISIDEPNQTADFSVKFKTNEIIFATGDILDVYATDSKRFTVELSGDPEYDTTTEELINTYIISADKVELAVQNNYASGNTIQQLYKHTLTLMQLSEYLVHHEIRNTVFSTSLESSQFIVDVGACAVSYHPTAALVGFGYMMHNEFAYVGTKEVGTIDLSKKKITQLKLKLDFLYQFVDSSNVAPVPGGILTSTIYFSMNGEYENITRWSDIYTSIGTQATEGAYLPTIRFTIGDDTRDLQLQSDDVKNGDTIVVPANIITWIQSKSGGTLTIEVLNATNNTTFLYNNTFANKQFNSYKIPMMVSFKATFYVNSVEMSVYDVIETLLKQQTKSTALYPKTSANYLFQMPTLQHNPDLYNLLKNTSSPNLIFTQSNFYDALVEIFKLFDAIFTIDKDGYLDIEYYNEQDKINAPSIAGKQLAITEEKYNDKLISYFQNTQIEDRFPNSNDEKATAYVRSKGLGVPSESDYVFMLPKPIYLIKKVKIKADLSRALYQWEEIGVNTSVYQYRFGDLPEQALDITENVVESSIWSLLPNDTTSLDNNKKYKYNCFSYTKGSNYIDISGYYNTTESIKRATINNVIAAGLARLFGYNEITLTAFFQKDIGENGFKNVKMSVDYISLADGKLVIENEENKYNGEMIINQGNGSIDINKLGLNMVGLSLKLGQPTMTMTQTFTTWENRVKKGQYFELNGERWVANVCNYTAIQDKIQATIEFVKSFNGLASRIQLNREKRLSNISNELTTKAEETYGEYIYYTSNSIQKARGVKVEQIALDESFLFNQLTMGFGYKMPKQKISPDLEATSYGKTTTELEAITNATRNTLYRVNGTVVAVLTRYLVITDGTTNTVIPRCMFSHNDTILWNIIEQRFEYNENATFITPTDVSVGDSIEVFIVRENRVNLFGAVGTYNGTIYYNNLRTPRFVFSNEYTMEYATLSALDTNNNILYADTQKVDNIAIPLLVYGSGNSVCFEMSYDSPISAGNQLLDNYTSEIWTNGWFSKAVLYTDLQGKADKFTINFVKMQQDLTRCYPQMVDNITNQNALSTYSFGKLEQFAYYKKPNEIFALNYQLHFLPLETIKQTTATIKDNGGFLANEYIKNNAFKNGLNKKNLHIVYSTNENDKYSILDTKGIGTSISITNIIGVKNTSALSNFNVLTLIFTAPTNAWNNIETWAIVDEENNIYYSSNLPPRIASNTSGEFLLSFITRHNKI